MSEKLEPKEPEEPEEPAFYKPGPLARDDYDVTYKRADRFNVVELKDEELQCLADVVDDTRAESHEVCVEAAVNAWAPIRPPFIDAHFSLWTMPEGRAQEIYDGTIIPPKWDALPWHGVCPDSGTKDIGRQAVNILRRDYTADRYENELELMRLQAEAELQDGIGELSPIRYAIYVQTTPSYTENMIISAIAEEYYFVAGYVSWADLVDPLLFDRVASLMRDPYLVGLRYDITQMAEELILDSTTDNNFAAIEHFGLPFELVIGPHQLRHACHIAFRHPKVKFVLNHCAMPTDYFSVMNPCSQIYQNWMTDLEYLSKYPNVMCKLTGATGWCNKVSYDSSESSDEKGSSPSYSKKSKKASSLVSDLYGSSDEDEAEGETASKEDSNAAQPTIYDSRNDMRAVNVMMHAISCFGPDRCIFGSGWPVSRAVLPSQTGWKDCAVRRQLSSVVVDRHKSARAKRVHHECLDLWEASRLVEHCLEETGFGAVDDKYKVFASNAASTYKLTVRPYGVNNIDAG